MKNKKAELTTQQLVTIIILILSFGVILFLFFRLNVGDTSDKEICHQSIILQGKSSLASGPIDCKTNYVCISGGGKCEGIQFTTTKEVNPSNPDEIMKVIAEEMADCWWMFGEGGVDYGSRTVTGINKVCSICSIILFDEKLKNEGAIKYEDFYNYLIENNRNTKTYLDYLYPGTNTLEILGEEFYIENYLENEIDLSKEYFILTGISKGSYSNTALLKQWREDYQPISLTILEKTANNYKNVVKCDQFVTTS